jgi:hypothetical protein
MSLHQHIESEQRYQTGGAAASGSLQPIIRGLSRRNLGFYPDAESCSRC